MSVTQKTIRISAQHQHEHDSPSLAGQPKPLKLQRHLLTASIWRSSNINRQQVGIKAAATLFVSRMG
jgi:hypothetical protein